jgi:hypothetical protein
MREPTAIAPGFPHRNQLAGVAGVAPVYLLSAQARGGEDGSIADDGLGKEMSWDEREKTPATEAGRDHCLRETEEYRGRRPREK